MIRVASPVFGQLAALADPTRGRILLLLEQQALAVTELCAVLQLPQSTVSRHLKVLAEEEWVSARAEGASRLYRLGLDSARRKLWQAVRDEISSAPSAEQDAQRLTSVLRERRSRSAAFFSATAADWEGVRRELYGSRVELLPLLALLEPSWVVGDLGCGTGQVARSLAPFVKRLIGVDASAAMIQAAQARTNGNRNIDLRIGELEQLPISDAELDAALLFLVLHYVVDPARALAEAGRVLKPGGTLVITDMLPHDRSDYRETMGHVWQGFAEEQLAAWLSAAGFQDFGFVELTPDSQAKGPLLFAARARRS